MKTVILGGENSERLYLKPAEFEIGNTLVKVIPTDLPDMDNVIARHKARYYLVKSFLRPQMVILDFPCGSGYASEIFNDVNINYHGMDNDENTIMYANIVYKTFNTYFVIENLYCPNLFPHSFDVIACIEGIEHIEHRYQKQLIKSFYDSLKSDGTLIITTPDTGYSGKSKKNPYHLGELTKPQFIKLLSESFENVEIITQKDILHTGEQVTLLFGICHKKGGITCQK